MNQLSTAKLIRRAGASNSLPGRRFGHVLRASVEDFLLLRHDFLQGLDHVRHRHFSPRRFQMTFAGICQTEKKFQIPEAHNIRPNRTQESHATDENSYSYLKNDQIFKKKQKKSLKKSAFVNYHALGLRGDGAVAPARFQSTRADNSPHSAASRDPFPTRLRFSSCVNLSLFWASEEAVGREEYIPYILTELHYTILCTVLYCTALYYTVLYTAFCCTYSV